MRPYHIGLVFVVLGLGGGAFGVYDYVQQSGTIEAAESVEATVTGTSVESFVQARVGEKYRPNVSFRYDYAGERYSSTHLYPATATPAYDERERVEEILDGYDEGGTVTAHVPPDAPGSAFLEAESSTQPLGIAAVGFLTVLLASGFTLNLYRASESSDEEA